MKVIQIKKNVIEFPFQDDNGDTIFTLEFAKSDENVDKFKKAFPELSKTIERMEKSKQEPTTKEISDLFKKTADSILGDGAYEKMYALSPFNYTVAGYIYQIAIGIKEELEEEDLKAVESKYLG